MRRLAMLAAFFAVAPALGDDRFPPIVPAKLDRDTPVVYQEEIEPIFEDRCIYCHSGNLTEGKFDMGTYQSLMKGGKSGKAIEPGKSEESLLFHLSTRNKKPMMPPRSEEPMTPEELALVKLWIDQGAKAPTGIRAKAKIVLSLPPAIVRPVRAVALTANGETIAASHGNHLHLFDSKTGVLKHTLKDTELKTSEGEVADAAHIAIVDALAFSPDGTTLASGSFQEMKLWDVETGALKKTISDFSDRVVAIDYSPDGSLIATGGGAPTINGEIRILKADGSPVKELPEAHSDTAFGVQFSPDGKHLATCGADKFVKVWDVASGEFVKSFEGHTHHVMDVGWKGDDGKILASGGADNVVKVWDFEKGEQTRTINAHGDHVTRLKFIGKTQFFVTVGGDKQLKQWDSNNGGNRRTYAGNTDYLYAVSVSADGKVVAAGGEEGVVRVYNGDNGQVIQTIDPANPPEAPEETAEKK